MVTPRFVVVENTPGYLPDDDDPATFEDIGEARVYASDLLSRLLDHIYDGYAIADDLLEDGSLPFEVSGSFAQQRTHDLGRVIEILETDES